MGTSGSFGLLAGGCTCHFWQGSGIHRLPFQHPHPDAGVDKSPFALCFLPSPGQCILHSSCGRVLQEEPVQQEQRSPQCGVCRDSVPQQGLP